MDQHQKVRPACKRGEPRRAVDLGAIVRRNDGSRHNVSVSEMSYRGCQVEGGPEFEIDERFTLVLPCCGESSAKVRWVSPGRAGVRFEVEAEDAHPPLFARPFFFGSGREFGKKGLEAAG
ncbi:MAG TPA: PilZ domain-containing protein [Sphingomicrobium sp.]